MRSPKSGQRRPEANRPDSRQGRSDGSVNGLFLAALHGDQVHHAAPDEGDAAASGDHSGKSSGAGLFVQALRGTAVKALECRYGECRRRGQSTRTQPGGHRARNWANVGYPKNW